MGRVLTISAVVLGVLAGAANAEPLLGIWASPPDQKGQTGHVRIDSCGPMLCGTLIKAFDPQGVEIVTANVGKRLIWNMKPSGDGAYDGGRVYVPLFGRAYDATMKLLGTKLEVKGCAIGICKAQTSNRVN